MSISDDLGTDVHMMYRVVEVFSDRNGWLTIDETNMKVVKPGLQLAGTYKTQSGTYYKVEDDLTVVDDTAAWERSDTL